MSTDSVSLYNNSGLPSIGLLTNGQSSVVVNDLTIKSSSNTAAITFIGNPGSGGATQTIIGQPNGLNVAGALVAAGVISANGSGLTSLNASQLTSGTVPTNTLGVKLAQLSTGDGSGLTNQPLFKTITTLGNISLVPSQNPDGSSNAQLSVSVPISSAISTNADGTVNNAVLFTNRGNVFTGSFTGNAGNATNLNASQLSGTVPLATIPVQVQTNNTYAATYIAAAKVTDNTSRNNLNFAFNDLVQMGVMSNVVTAGCLDPNYNSTNHFDFLQQGFGITNEQYISGPFGQAGLNCGGTNYVVIPLPRPITNYTLVVWMWNSPSNADRLIGLNWSVPPAIAHLYNTNDFSGMVFDQPTSGRGARIWSSSIGTNFVTSGGPSQYGASPMLNGQYDDRTPFGLPYVNEYSSGTNGIVCHFQNSKPSRFVDGGESTYDKFLATNSPYNMLVIGGAATNWGMTYVNNTNCIATIGGWILFDARSDGDWKYQVAGYKFATDLMRYVDVTEFGGSSLVNDSFTGGNAFQAGTVCETNTMPTIYQQQNPFTLTLCDAAPGSSMANYASMSNKGTNYFLPYDLFNLNTNRYVKRKVENDGPRNDALGLASLPTIYGFFTNWDCYFSSGIPFFLIDDHWDYSTSLDGNLNWRKTILMIESNLPISGVIVESTHIGSNFLSHASLDNPPVHPDSQNWQAYQLSSGFAALCSFQPWPYPWLDVTWNGISQGNPLMDAGITNMNQMYVTVIDAQGNVRVTQDASGLTNGFQNTPTYTNFLFGSSFTNTGTRSDLVVVNARCNPTTVVSALFGLVTSPTGATYTTNSVAGLEADTIFTTTPHGWFQLTAIVQPGGIWKVVDISGGGAVTITNSYYQTLQ